MAMILSDEPLLVADAGQEPEGAVGGHAAAAPEGEEATTEGGSSPALSVIPEEADRDFSAHIQQVI